MVYLAVVSPEAEDAHTVVIENRLELADDMVRSAPDEGALHASHVDGGRLDHRPAPGGYLDQCLAVGSGSITRGRTPDRVGEARKFARHPHELASVAFRFFFGLGDVALQKLSEVLRAGFIPRRPGGRRVEVLDLLADIEVGV